MFFKKFVNTWMKKNMILKDNILFNNNFILLYKFKNRRFYYGNRKKICSVKNAKKFRKL